mgnify:CR=1 FL=1
MQGDMLIASPEAPSWVRENSVFVVLCIDIPYGRRLDDPYGCADDLIEECVMSLLEVRDDGIWCSPSNYFYDHFMLVSRAL